MGLDARELRDAFGAFLTGVTVVTTTGEAREPIGFTANSFTSVSLDPPLLLVCLAKTSRNAATFTQAKGFAVNVLSDGQKEISNTFARPVEDRFAVVRWAESPLGSPVFDDVAAWFDCTKHEVIDAGDHLVLMGRIEHFRNSGKRGLGYARGGYFTPTLTEKHLLAKADRTLMLGVVAERRGEVLLIRDGQDGWTIPFVEKTEGEGVEVLQRQLQKRIGLTPHIGFLYSVYDDTDTGLQHVVYRASLGDGQPQEGEFFPAPEAARMTIRDSAVRDIVKRYAQESTLGNFGIYFGNQVSGTVHAAPAQRGIA
ncbi:putative flavin reductase [Castellaniella defragrans]